MQQIANYVIVALFTSIVWFGIYLHKLNKLDLKYLNETIKLDSLRIKYNDLLFRFELLSKVSAPIATNPIDIALGVLGLSRGASVQEIKNKYRALVKQYHPDRNTSPSAPDKFKAINNAYKVLTK